jgi:outer membrane murein-binding lipoprotein Lpp
MKKITTTAMLLALALTAGCSSNQPNVAQAKKDEAAPINCATAQTDLNNLNSEKARTSQEIEDGASSIIPIGAVVHLFSKDEGDSFKIGTGQYNDAIDKKIAEIKATCNIK